MRISALCVTLLVASHTSIAVAQKPAEKGGRAMKPAAAGSKLADVAGTWSVQNTIGPKDTVITSEVVATADGKGWVTKIPGRPPIPTRIIGMGGDSVVTEAGPFESVLRPGQMVTTRSTLHFKGDAATGTLQARYASDTLTGKLTAKRKK